SRQLPARSSSSSSPSELSVCEWRDGARVAEAGFEWNVEGRGLVSRWAGGTAEADPVDDHELIGQLHQVDEAPHLFVRPLHRELDPDGGGPNGTAVGAVGAGGVSNVLRLAVRECIAGWFEMTGGGQ